jgi:hypothetical protein
MVHAFGSGYRAGAAAIVIYPNSMTGSSEGWTWESHR